MADKSSTSPQRSLRRRSVRLQAANQSTEVSDPVRPHSRNNSPHPSNTRKISSSTLIDNESTSPNRSSKGRKRPIQKSESKIDHSAGPGPSNEQQPSGAEGTVFRKGGKGKKGKGKKLKEILEVKNKAKQKALKDSVQKGKKQKSHSKQSASSDSSPELVSSRVKKGGKRKGVVGESGAESSGEPVAKRTRSRSFSSETTPSQPSPDTSETPAGSKGATKGAGKGRASRRRERVRRGGGGGKRKSCLAASPSPDLGNTTGSCASSRSRRVSGRSAAGGTEARPDAGGSAAAHNSSTGGSGAMSGSGGPGQQDGGGQGQQQGAGPSRELPPLPPEAAGASGGPFLFPPLDDDDMDSSRLQALLEARGLPPHILGALGPRMQQLIHRSMPGASKAQQLIEGLQSPDESTQLTACVELGQLLVMGNEDTLAGFPVKQCVPELVKLLQMEHNFEMMLSACRAVSNMLDALPRSASTMVEHIPVLVNKLKNIMVMDVAEQALNALELLSRRHAKAVLVADALKNSLEFIDFMSLPAQRSALQMTSHCCQAVTPADFHHVSPSLQILVDRLRGSDKRCVESVVQAFSYLVNGLAAQPKLLKDLAAPGLLEAYQHVFQLTPPLISSVMFINALKSLSMMCDACPDLAVVLLRADIADTICYLLVGQVGASPSLELVSRSSEETMAIVSVISDLLPRLPEDDIFQISQVMKKKTVLDWPVVWQWRDDSGVWRTYSHTDCRILEEAKEANEDEISLEVNGRSYSVDMREMSQMNEDTGNRRAMQRRENTKDGEESGEPEVSMPDPRAATLTENQDLCSSFVKTLFPVVYTAYCSSAGPNVRYKCLIILLKICYFCEPELLKSVLKDHAISSNIAGMLGSSDLSVVVAAMQLAVTLIRKMPDVFNIFYRREGVMHQIARLQEGTCDSAASSPAAKDASTGPQLSSGAPGGDKPETGGASGVAGAVGGAPDESSSAAAAEDASSQDKPQRTLSEALKRKKPPTRKSGRKGSKEEASDPPTRKGKGGRDGNSSRGPGGKSGLSFLAHLSPSRWGRHSQPPSQRDSPKSGGRKEAKSKGAEEASGSSRLSSTAMANASRVALNDKMRSWIKEQASQFYERYVAGAEQPSDPALSLMEDVTSAVTLLKNSGTSDPVVSLRHISRLVCECDPSPFEIVHSGLLGVLTDFLTSPHPPLARDTRLRAFCHVFMAAPAPERVGGSVEQEEELNPAPLQALISRLMACVVQLEQFQVKVTDIPGASGPGRAGGGSALKFLNSHQLKCQLERAPDCKSLREWRGGPVKIDPLALLSAVERYLVIRGYSKLKDVEGDMSDDSHSDDDMDDPLAAMQLTTGQGRHRLEFLIGTHVIPHSMTIYQAVAQFSSGAEGDGDDHDSLAINNLWAGTHVLRYRPVTEESCREVTPKKPRPEGRGGRGKKDELWNDGVVPAPGSRLEPYLSGGLPASVTVADPSLPVLALLRLLFGISQHWGELYHYVQYKAAVSREDLTCGGVSGKAWRQLQDPLIIMTANLPLWLTQLAHACPFLLSFEVRQLLFYVTSFDRDRAMLKMNEAAGDTASGDGTDRVMPRQEMKQRHNVRRPELLSNAEKVMEDSGTNKAFIEIQYDQEHGTGLGPTLEFYSLVCREMQRAELEMWRGDVSQALDHEGKEMIDYVHCAAGLFPAPLGKHAKAATVAKVKSKFKFFGKFVAKAVMDGRLLDFHLSSAMGEWLLSNEQLLGPSSLEGVLDPVFARSLTRLQTLSARYRALKAPANTQDRSAAEVEEERGAICGEVDDLCLNFLLPGPGSIELQKGGKDIAVTVDNLDDYIKLVTHWTLVRGVWKQMESFREGFEAVFPLDNLRLFYSDELDQVFCGSGSDEGWDVRTLSEACRCDHGYTPDSAVVQWLFRLLESYSPDLRRHFVQFVTGAPRLPVGGFRSLSPALMIVRKTFEPPAQPDSFLPSVMTCRNYLKLPEYSSPKVLAERLHQAISEGKLSFHLS